MRYLARLNDETSLVPLLTNKPGNIFLDQTLGTGIFICGALKDRNKEKLAENQCAQA
eukprot:UN17638